MISKRSFAGPSAYMEILLKYYGNHKEKVLCTDLKDKNKKNPKKCSISSQDSFKIDYQLVDRESHTMYPEQISIYGKTRNATDLQLIVKYTFVDFKPIFGGEQVISSNLPIGFGCRRLNSKNYPKIESKYGNRFELDQEIAFNYQIERDPSSKSQTYCSEKYSNRMYVDLDKSMNSAETIDEDTKQPIKTIYDLKTNLLYSINSKGVCVAYNLRSMKSLNWFYIQDSFVKFAPLHYANSSYSYTGEYEIDDKQYLIFEKKFRFESTYYAWQANRDAKQRSTTKRKNKNGLQNFDWILATHYYPKDSWSGNSNGLLVPERIEIRFLYLGFIEKGNLSIRIKSVASSSKGYKKYATKNCKLVD